MDNDQHAWSFLFRDIFIIICTFNVCCDCLPLKGVFFALELTFCLYLGSFRIIFGLFLHVNLIKCLLSLGFHLTVQLLGSCGSWGPVTASWPPVNLPCGVFSLALCFLVTTHDLPPRPLGL